MRRLDLDDIGAGLSHQQCRVWPLIDLTEIDDHDAGERQVGRVGHFETLESCEPELLRRLTSERRDRPRVLGETLAFRLAVADVAEAVDGDVGVGLRHAFCSKGVLDDLVLLGQQRATFNPARGQNLVAVSRRSAQYCLGVAGDINRQRLLHRPGRNVGLRNMVVPEFHRPLLH